MQDPKFAIMGGHCVFKVPSLGTMYVFLWDSPNMLVCDILKIDFSSDNFSIIFFFVNE